jgi:hypothetical protein
MSNGDPHMVSFSGKSFDLMGLGVFPLVDLDGLKAQTFHCPVAKGKVVGASSNVGLALSTGTDVLVILGETIKSTQLPPERRILLHVRF